MQKIEPKLPAYRCRYDAPSDTLVFDVVVGNRWIIQPVEKVSQCDDLAAKWQEFVTQASQIVWKDTYELQNLWSVNTKTWINWWCLLLLCLQSSPEGHGGCLGRWLLELATCFKVANKPSTFSHFDPIFDFSPLNGFRWPILQYPISDQEKAHLIELQENRCAICGGDGWTINNNCRNLAVDHNHETNEVRGLLCSACNLGLGCFKDKVSNLRKAIAYLTNPPVPKELNISRSEVETFVRERGARDLDQIS